MSNHYNKTATPRPGRSAFDLSHGKMFDCSIGQLVPVLLEEGLPGDVFQIGKYSVIRSQPLMTPIYHDIRVYTHYFSVPVRLIYKPWEKLITGGASGDDNTTLKYITEDTEGGSTNHPIRFSKYGLYDFFGFPMHDTSNGEPKNEMDVDLGENSIPINDLPWRAYWAVWRDYYRDSNHMPTWPGTSNQIGQDDHELIDSLSDFVKRLHYQGGADYNTLRCDSIAYRCWRKDYFTSALPYQQRGTSPVIPISGQSSAFWDYSNFLYPAVGEDDPTILLGFGDSGATEGKFQVSHNDVVDPKERAKQGLNNNIVDFEASGVDMHDFRLALKTQQWMERSMRGGYRYGEQMQSHFGTKPQDYRLNKPEYLGGTSEKIMTSEVLQTSETQETPQGTMTGHGICATDSFVGRYRCPEHCVIIGIMSIMPEAVYQQGVPRQWSKRSRFDFYFPEFAHLSEQEIKKQELFYSADPEVDDERFGFQAAFDEYRTRRSMVCGKLASDLHYWHLSRIFDGPPNLNPSFLTTQNHSENRRDAWAVTEVADNIVGQFLVKWRNNVKAIRPMPAISDPGLENF